MRSVDPLSAATVARNRPGSNEGSALSSRMCTWMIAAPSASHSLAVETSSSSVTGRAGTAALVLSAPVGATVIRVPVLMGRSCHDQDRPIGVAVDNRGLWITAESSAASGRIDRGGRLADLQVGVVNHTALDHCERDHAEFVVPDAGADEADLT